MQARGSRSGLQRLFEAHRVKIYRETCAQAGPFTTRMSIVGVINELLFLTTRLAVSMVRYVADSSAGNESALMFPSI